MTNDLTTNIDKYNPNVGPWTPVSGSNTSFTTILIQLEVDGIRSVDLDSSSVTFSGVFRQWWNDSRLAWNPSDYGGI